MPLGWVSLHGCFAVGLVGVSGWCFLDGLLSVSGLEFGVCRLLIAGGWFSFGLVCVDW